MGPDSRDQDQHGQDPHPLGDDAKAGGEPAEPVPAPAPLTEQETDETVDAEGDEEGHQGVDLRRLGLQGELDGEQQQQAGHEAHLRAPQPAAQIPHQRYGQQTRQQGGQQEGHLDGAGQQIPYRYPPHKHGGLVRIDLAAAHGEQPLAALHHLLGHQGETGLIGRPGIPQAQTRSQHHQGDQQQPAQGALVEQEAITRHHRAPPGWWPACPGSSRDAGCPDRGCRGR